MNFVEKVRAKRLALSVASWIHVFVVVFSGGMLRRGGSLLRSCLLMRHHCFECRGSSLSLFRSVRVCSLKALESKVSACRCASCSFGLPCASCFCRIAVLHACVSQGCVAFVSLMVRVGMCFFAVVSMRSVSFCASVLGSSEKKVCQSIEANVSLSLSQFASLNSRPYVGV